MDFIKLAKLVIFCIVFRFTACPCLGQVVNFPYNQSLRSTTAPVGIVRPNPNSNSARFTESGLILTENARNSFGAILFNGSKFDLTNGIELEFEYSMYGGTTFDGVNGDGLAVFLYDANTSPVNIGNSGGGLGYINLSGAYLGVGFDQYGNFKKEMLGPVGWANRIIQGGLTGADNVGDMNSHITLRGNAASGQHVLTTIATRSFQGENPNRIWDNAAKRYVIPQFRMSSTDAFELRPAGLSTSDGSSTYRKAFLSLLPHRDGGFRVTVRVQNGSRITTVIDNYHYPNAITLSNRIANTTPPKQFRIGFAAATGSATQTHLIRDLSISLPFTPNTKEDEINSFCNGFGSGLDPFVNDTFYNGHLYDNPRAGSGENVDVNSFWFVDKDGKRLSTTNRWIEREKGVWEFDPVKRLVYFKPFANFSGSVTVHYTIKGSASQGGPFNQEVYRSTPTAIKATVINCGAVVNPQLRSR